MSLEKHPLLGREVLNKKNIGRFVSKLNDMLVADGTDNHEA